MAARELNVRPTSLVESSGRAVLAQKQLSAQNIVFFHLFFEPYHCDPFVGGFD